MEYDEHKRPERENKHNRNANHANGAANFKPNYDTDSLTREQQYEMALYDQGYQPDKVQGYDEFKPGKLRYNPSKTYNLRVLDRQRGHRMLGVAVIGDTWTDPRTPAGRSMYAQNNNYLNYAGGTRVNDPQIPAYKPSQRLRYEQLAQQIGEEQIKQNVTATLEKCQRYREAISLKINDKCTPWEEKNEYFAKRDKLDALTNNLLKGIGQATGKELPEIDEANGANYFKAGTLALLAFVYLNSESLALLGLIATLYFKLHDGMDEVRDIAIDDLLRDTGVGRPDGKKEAEPDPVFAPKGHETEQKDEEGCEVKPIGRHLGNDPIHNQCSDFAPPNVFMGSDVLVTTPDGRRKHFDALDTSGALWEVKTTEYSTYSDFLKDITLGTNLAEMEEDFKIASACGRKFIFAVADSEQYEALDKLKPIGVELRLVDCLSLKGTKK